VCLRNSLQSAPFLQRSENAELQSELRSLQNQLDHNRRQQVQTVEALRAENESLMKHNDMLQTEVSRLRRVESDRIVRSALDQSTEVRDVHDVSSTVQRGWASGNSQQPLERSRVEAAPTSTSAGQMRLHTSSASVSGRPPRMPTHPSFSMSAGGMFDLDTSGVAASPEARGGAGAGGMDDSIASSRSLLRALQGTALSPHAPPSSADDGELAMLMSALSAAAAPSNSAPPAPSNAASTASTTSNTPGRSVPGDHVLNSTRGSVAEQLQRVAAAQSRLAGSTRPAAASAAQQTRRAGAHDGTAAVLGDDWWQGLAHAVPADRVELLQSYLRQHDTGKLSASSLATRARVLLVDSVTSTARTASGGTVASKATRETLVQQLSKAVGGE